MTESMEKYAKKQEKLLKFYNKKAKEPKGGTFFKVMNGATDLGTVWARSKQEIIDLHNKKRVPFTSVVETV